MEKSKACFRPCAISSTRECCAALGRVRPSDGEPAFPRDAILCRGRPRSNPAATRGGRREHPCRAPCPARSPDPFEALGVLPRAPHIGVGRADDHRLRLLLQRTYPPPRAAEAHPLVAETLSFLPQP